MTTLSMYEVSAPLFVRMLNNLLALIAKAEANAAARAYDPEILVQARLAPDMLPFVGQIQRASDTAKNVSARFAQQTPPAFPDTEKTLAEVKDRIKRTIDYIQSLPAAAFEGAESREVVLKPPGREVRSSGLAHLTEFGLPNFYFHVTTAYAILRHNGVDLGKMDFLGPMQ